METSRQRQVTYAGESARYCKQCQQTLTLVLITDPRFCGSACLYKYRRSWPTTWTCLDFETITARFSF